MSSFQYLCKILAVSIILLSARVVYSSDKIPVMTVLDEVWKRRAFKPISYEFDFRIRSNSLYRGNSTNKHWNGALSEMTGVIRTDELAGVTYVESTKKLVHPYFETPEEERAIIDRYSKNGDLGIRLILPDREFIRFPTGGKLYERSVDEQGLQTIPLFDYRMLGWANQEELRRSPGLDVVIRDFKAVWPKHLNFEVDEKGIATLDLSDEEFKIDTERDYWLISRTRWNCTRAAAEHRGSKRIVIESTKIVLEEFERQWLPKRVELRADHKNTQVSLGYDFTWKSFNKSIDPDKLTPEYARQRIKNNEENKSKTSKKE